MLNACVDLGRRNGLSALARRAMEDSDFCKFRSARQRSLIIRYVCAVDSRSRSMLRLLLPAAALLLRNSSLICADDQDRRRRVDQPLDCVRAHLGLDWTPIDTLAHCRRGEPWFGLSVVGVKPN